MDKFVVVVIIYILQYSLADDDSITPLSDNINEVILKKCPNHRKHVYAPKCLWNSLLPLPEDCESLPVEIDIVPKQFRWIDDPRQEFTFLAQIKMSWPLFCPDLVTPNRTLVVIVVDGQFWTPILIHMNSAYNANLAAGNFNKQFGLILNPSGTKSAFKMISYGLLTSTVSMKFKKFPFDTQTMAVEFSLEANNYRNHISSIEFPSMVGNDYFMP